MCSTDYQLYGYFVLWDSFDMLHSPTGCSNWWGINQIIITNNNYMGKTGVLPLAYNASPDTHRSIASCLRPLVDIYNTLYTMYFNSLSIVSSKVHCQPCLEMSWIARGTVWMQSIFSATELLLPTPAPEYIQDSVVAMDFRERLIRWTIHLLEKLFGHYQSSHWGTPGKLPRVLKKRDWKPLA